MLPFMFSMVLSDKQARSSKKVTNVIYFVMFRKAEIFRSNNNDKETNNTYTESSILNKNSKNGINADCF